MGHPFIFISFNYIQIFLFLFFFGEKLFSSYSTKFTITLKTTCKPQIIYKRTLIQNILLFPNSPRHSSDELTECMHGLKVIGLCLQKMRVKISIQIFRENHKLYRQQKPSLKSFFVNHKLEAFKLQGVRTIKSFPLLIKV